MDSLRLVFPPAAAALIAFPVSTFHSFLFFCFLNNNAFPYMPLLPPKIREFCKTIANVYYSLKYDLLYSFSLFNAFRIGHITTVFSASSVPI